MEIHIKTIPHSEQRYPTVGDYFYENGVLEVRISEMHNDKYHFLVALHEIIEEFLTRDDGITEEQITEFDLKYEEKRDKGLVPEDSEPGFADDCPYRLHHTIATAHEMNIAALCGVNWMEYDKTVNSL
jgi:hypothetical protein